MKLLLDSHAFIWWDSEPSRLSPTARGACENQENLICVSTASIWEIQIKVQLGKLQLRLPLPRLVNEQLTNGVLFIPVQVDSILRLSNLPDIHRDPFDRLIISQAILEDAPVITTDPVFSQYPVKVLW